MRLWTILYLFRDDPLLLLLGSEAGGAAAPGDLVPSSLDDPNRASITTQATPLLFSPHPSGFQPRPGVFIRAPSPQWEIKYEFYPLPPPVQPHKSVQNSAGAFETSKCFPGQKAPKADLHLSGPLQSSKPWSFFAAV